MSLNRTLLSIVFVTAMLSGIALAQEGIWNIDPELKGEIRLSKINHWLVPALKESGVDVWLVFTRDAQDDPTDVIWPEKRDIRLDPVSELIGAEKVFKPAAFLFTADGERTAFCAELDAGSIRESGIYSKVLTYRFSRQSSFHNIYDLLREEVSRVDPQKIALNFSESEPVADGLTVGMMRILERALGPEYAKRFVSGEDIVVSLWGRNAPEEIELLQRSAEISDRLNREALGIIRPGETTERDIFNYYRFRMKQLGVAPGWQEQRAPIVHAGDPESGRVPGDVVVQRGRVVKINGAVRVKGYCVDLNKTAYVLREGETEPPAAIQQMFDAVAESIRQAAEAMKPGVLCSVPNDIARKVIREAGFEDWRYGTGHSVGAWIHGLGPTIAPDWPGYGRKPQMKIAVGDCYALEPTVGTFIPELGVEVRIHNQEMVLIKEDGAHWMVPPQTELVLIR
jgi:Xaa-Pro aminopeptidase